MRCRGTRALAEAAADQDLLERARVGQRVEYPDLLEAADTEVAQVVLRHRPRSAAQGDLADRQTVEGDPQHGPIWQVDVGHLDGQQRETAAAAEPRLVGGP